MTQARRTHDQQSDEVYRPGYEVAAEQLLELIARAGLRPGDRLPTENELAMQLGTSRTVVREAVKILSALGRIRAHKGRGLFVADDEGMLGTGRWASFFVPDDLDHVYMLFEFRRAQEMETSRLAAHRATPAEMAAIQRAADLCRHGFDIGSEDVFTEGDDLFHRSVSIASHNMFLQVAVAEARRLQAQSNLFGMRGTIGGHAGKAVAEHEAIHQAIRAGDPEAAAQAAATHIDNTLDEYRRAIQQRIFSSDR
ncbi:FadR/GntR family transcriptional regulator [Hamadaea tsunoensis]|uniref:FadR/GntR family transcriptional regulator n=1 Tax=Hamadaea tsunoensis TaxID=53368 RepID=UPI00041BCC1D|nr:FCD domain-containing protein [Hamadaea tsunoensis]